KGATTRQLSHNLSEKNPHPSWHSTHRTTPPREPLRVFAVRLMLASSHMTCRHLPSAIAGEMVGPCVGAFAPVSCLPRRLDLGFDCCPGWEMASGSGIHCHYAGERAWHTIA